MSRNQIYEKYFNSDIFNNAPVITEQIPKVRIRESLATTKNDIFNTEKKIITHTKKFENRQAAYSKIYGSDIFCQNKPNDTKNKVTIKKVRNASNLSSCFDNMKNNLEYKKNLENYTTERRIQKKIYKPDKYLKKEKPAERYYKEMYGNNSKIFPESGFYTDRINKENYAEKKRNLKNDINKKNDEVSEINKNPNVDKQIYSKKKINWSEKNSIGYQYIDSKINPGKNAKINKQMYLRSNLFHDDKKEDEKISYNKIKSRLEEETKKDYLNNTFHLDINKHKRILTGNDRTLFGAVHTKWEKSNIDWHNPKTELMFGNQISKDLNKNFGPDGPTPFQRKLNQLADTKNLDTITENKKQPINNIVKPITQNKIDDIRIKNMEKILEEIPNLKEDKKLKIKMNVANPLLNQDKDIENKIKAMSNFYTNPIKEKNKKKEVTAKVGKYGDILKEKNTNDFNEYVLNYGKKGNFEKFGENEIKKMFAKYGIHIYDIHKNMFDKGSYNSIQFKVRENKDGQEILKQKINDVEQYLGKNYQVKINKEKKKDVKINYKNFVTNPGSKVGILNENIENQKKD